MELKPTIGILTEENVAAIEEGLFACIQRRTERLVVTLEANTQKLKNELSTKYGVTVTDEDLRRAIFEQFGVKSKGGE